MKTDPEGELILIFLPEITEQKFLLFMVLILNEVSHNLLAGVSSIPGKFMKKLIGSVQD